MASIFKKDRRRKNAPWYIDYFDENGVRRRVKGCTDRTASDQIARKLESDVELRRRGIIDAKSDRYSEAERKTLADHLDDFQAAIIAKANTTKHASLFVERARRVVALMKEGRLAEI